MDPTIFFCNALIPILVSGCDVFDEITHISFSELQYLLNKGKIFYLNLNIEDFLLFTVNYTDLPNA